MIITLRHPALAEKTGKGVSVAVVDSGIHATHPHVGGIAGGVCLVPGRPPDDFSDRLGHGTAVAAAIKDKAPQVTLHAVRVFDVALRANVGTLIRGIDWAVARGIRIVNLSLGTTNTAQEHRLTECIQRARAKGTWIVSAAEHDGERWLPGGLAGVIGVRLDADCDRDACRVVQERSVDILFHASGYPRPIPGVPREHNVSGISFAVANVTGFLARLLEDGDILDPRDIGARLGISRSS